MGVECDHYYMEYNEKIYDVFIRIKSENDIVSNITAMAIRDAWTLTYDLFYEIDEAYIYISDIKTNIHVDPMEALAVIDEILKKGKVVGRRKC